MMLLMLRGECARVCRSSSAGDGVRVARQPASVPPMSPPLSRLTTTTTSILNLNLITTILIIIMPVVVSGSRRWSVVASVAVVQLPSGRRHAPSRLTQRTYTRSLTYLLA